MTSGTVRAPGHLLEERVALRFEDAVGHVEAAERGPPGDLLAGKVYQGSAESLEGLESGPEDDPGDAAPEDRARAHGAGLGGPVEEEGRRVHPGSPVEKVHHPRPPPVDEGGLS